MKKIILTVICLIFLICMSSCRSMSSSCGLADNQPTQTSLQQVDLL